MQGVIAPALLTPCPEFDVATILNGPLEYIPMKPKREFISLVVPEGISFNSLYDSETGVRFLEKQDYYKQFDWAVTPLKGGIYQLRSPIPGSGNKTFNDQKLLLLEGEEIASATLMAIAQLCVKRTSHFDLLINDWVRCAEQIPNGPRIALSWGGMGLSVSPSFDGDHYDFICAASARRIV